MENDAMISPSNCSLPPRKPRLSRLAIASFVMGLVILLFALTGAVFFFFDIELPGSSYLSPAIIFVVLNTCFYGSIISAVAAILIIPKSHGQLTGHALAWMGISPAALMLLIGLFEPFVPRDRHANPSKQMRCMRNLAEIGKALQAYANDNEDKYPPSPIELFPRWFTGWGSFYCPSSGVHRPSKGEHHELKDDVSICYRYVSYPVGTPRPVLSELPVVFDKSINHLFKDMNVLYGDGHLMRLKRATFIANLRNMTADEKLPKACRDVLKQTLKTVEEEGRK
jgi:prepilin-type processing-associated H-X9-DG protein